MKKQIILLLLLATIVLCRCRRDAPAVLNEQGLPSTFYDVRLSKDTVITTAKGGIIRIAAGSLTAGSDTHARLEVKEAYIMADMIAGGLTTRAGKDLLSSGGMIYIHPAGNTTVTIAKPLQVGLPTRDRQQGMQLYKGEKKDDGSIDWRDPQPLPDPVVKGGKLFIEKCAACHNATKEGAGPPLAFLDQRRDWVRLLRAVQVGHEEGHEEELGYYAACLFERYNHKLMPAFPQLSADDVRAIFSYINYQVRDIDPATIPDYKKSWDSCRVYFFARHDAQMRRDGLLRGNGRFVNEQTNSTGTVRLTTPLPDEVKPVDKQSVYYDIKIETFGWYNVDMLVKAVPGLVSSELIATVSGACSGEVNIYLAVPDVKLFADGGPLPGKPGTYGFDTKNGRIPLPQNAKAWIMATTECDGKLYFGKTAFTTSPQQSPTVRLYAVTKEEMNAQINEIGLDGVNITAGDSKNAESIRKIDVVLDDIEKLKPKNCDCYCGYTRYDEYWQAWRKQRDAMKRQ